MYHERTKPDNLEDDRVHHRKEVIGDNGVEMTKDEIEAMMDELMSNPVEGIHTERTYEIMKNQDGAVKVTRLPPENLTLEGIGGRTKEKEVSKRIDEEIEKRTLCLNWITRFGSDPPTSDRQSMGADERKKSKSRKSRPNWSKPSKVVGHEVDRVPIQYLDTSIHSPEDGKHIKEEEEAHQDVVQKVLSPLSSDLPSSKITPCLKTMSVNPLPQAMAPPTPPPTLPQKNRKVKYLPPKAPDPEGSGSFGIAPCPSDTRPGILAAAHLAKIPFQGSSHQEPLFFVFGSTIVLEDDRGDTHTYQGNALVHLYTQPLDSTLDEPPPPPAKKTKEARSQLFRYSPGRPPGMRPHQFDHLERPLQSFSVDPKADANNPFARRLEQRLRQAQEEKDELDEAEAAEVLVSLRNKRKVEGNSAGTKPVGQTGDPSHSFVPSAAIPRLIEFVKGGTIPGSNIEGVKLEEREDGANAFIRGIQQPSATTGKSNVPTEPIAGPPTTPSESPDIEMVPSNAPTPGKDEATCFKPDDTKVYDPRLAIVRNTVPANTHPLQTHATTRSTQQEPDKFLSITEWREMTDKLEMEVRNGTKWTDNRIRKIFAAARLTDWWMAIGRLGEKEGRRDWHAWRVEAVMNKAKENLPTSATWIVGVANSIIKIREDNQPR